MAATYRPERMAPVLSREEAIGQLIGEALDAAARTLASDARMVSVDVEVAPGAMRLRVWRDGRNEVLAGAI